MPEVRNIGRIEQCKLLPDRLSLTSNLLPFTPEALDGEPSPFILLCLTRPFLIFTLFLATAPLYSAHSLCSLSLSLRFLAHLQRLHSKPRASPLTMHFVVLASAASAAFVGVSAVMIPGGYSHAARHVERVADVEGYSEVCVI